MEKEKEELQKRIEKLLSFDGREVTIHPDHLACFRIEELREIETKLQKNADRMVEEHREWLLRLASGSEGS